MLSIINSKLMLLSKHHDRSKEILQKKGRAYIWVCYRVTLASSQYKGSLFWVAIKAWSFHSLFCRAFNNTFPDFWTSDPAFSFCNEPYKLHAQCSLIWQRMGHPYRSWSSQYFKDWTCPEDRTFYAWNCSLFGTKLSEEPRLPSRSEMTLTNPRLDRFIIWHKRSENAQISLFCFVSALGKKPHQS